MLSTTSLSTPYTMAFRDDKNANIGPDIERRCYSNSCLEGKKIKRDLKSRHINMIAIAGMIVSLVV